MRYVAALARRWIAGAGRRRSGQSPTRGRSSAAGAGALKVSFGAAAISVPRATHQRPSLALGPSGKLVDIAPGNASAPPRSWCARVTACWLVVNLC